jgi:hypothetical protein
MSGQAVQPAFAMLQDEVERSIEHDFDVWFEHGASGYVVKLKTQLCDWGGVRHHHGAVGGDVLVYERMLHQRMAYWRLFAADYHLQDDSISSEPIVLPETDRKLLVEQYEKSQEMSRFRARISELDYLNENERLELQNQNLKKENSVLQSFLQNQTSSDVRLIEERKGVVSAIANDHVEITYELDGDEYLKQTYSADQFLGAEGPKEGQMVLARITLSVIDEKPSYGEDYEAPSLEKHTSVENVRL